MIKFLEKMFHATSAAILVFDAAGEIIWINDVFDRCFGYDLTHLQKTARWLF